MSKIFISYRRTDSADVTGRIGDRLRLHFGSDNVFTDVDDIPLGVDFRAVLDAAVSQCDVVLVVIGRDWVSSTNKAGELRLSDPADFVRIEIESALRRDIPVIPLLVRGAGMPQPSPLPEPIKQLPFPNGTP
ncbi:MAG: toll/interleukin-1 receptor domain-containing protein [Granulosicoccus sp.]